MNMRLETCFKYSNEVCKQKSLKVIQNNLLLHILTVMLLFWLFTVFALVYPLKINALYSSKSHLHNGKLPSKVDVIEWENARVRLSKTIVH